MATADISNPILNSPYEPPAEHFEIAAAHIQALAVRDDAAQGVPSRVGITVGPQYGTVGPAFIKDAAREAIRAADLDLLCVLGFAFDPAVLGAGDGYVTTSPTPARFAATTPTRSPCG